MNTELMMAIDPDATRRRWLHEFEWHLDAVPAILDALVEATLPQIPVSRGGSRFDKDQITGGGFFDNMRQLDQVDNAAATDARELWTWVVEYTRAAALWIDAERPAPLLTDNHNPNPAKARGEALVTAGWLIDHAPLIAEVRELEEHREAMFSLIRRLRGQYGVFNHPRRQRPAVCTTCGERSVVVDWVDSGTDSPKPVQAGRCRRCGEIFRADEGKAA